MVKRQTKGERVFQVFNILFMLFMLAVTFYPFFYCVLCSFSDADQLVGNRGLMLLPKGFSTAAYQMVFANPNIRSGYMVTVFVVVTGTVLDVVLTSIGAFLVTRKHFPLGKAMPYMMLFTMYFSGGMIPTYLAMKSFGLLNSPFAVILPGAVNVTNLIIARTYFATSIPWELQEAATIDGCSNTGLFLKIVLPLSMPIVAVIALYYLVGHWNAYFNALIYLSNEKLYPLQLFLRNILLMDQMTEMMEGDSEALQALMRRLQLKESMKYGIVVLSSLPVLVIYPFLQKYFVKGMMIGAIKG